MAQRRKRVSSEITVTRPDGTQETVKSTAFRPEGKRRCSRCGEWIKKPRKPHRFWFCQACRDDQRLADQWRKPPP